ncbi:MAG: DUF6345 domain-containing protein [Hadesarchaea archaeon]|nr:DUF6345 domain-containing protein [Hadesarchaea archaeon]MDH5685854.1 DUF6345 domain-containing protein [Hadesarchaea archaeon]
MRKKLKDFHVSIRAIALVVFFIISTALVPFVRAGNDDSNNKEIGVWWVNDYTNNPYYGSYIFPPNSDDDAEGFYNNLGSKGFTKSFDKGDGNAWEKHFEKSENGGLDYSYADAVDFIYFAGHGRSDGFRFGINKDGDDYDNTMYKVHYSEALWGDKDLEWIFITACEVLKHEYWNNWKGVFNSPPMLHGMTGFHTSVTNTDILGGQFAAYLTDQFGPFSIKDAWQKATKAVFNATDKEAAVCAVWIYNYGVYVKYWDEYLPGYESGMMSDPSGTTSIGYVKWTCKL